MSDGEEMDGLIEEETCHGAAEVPVNPALKNRSLAMIMVALHDAERELVNLDGEIARHSAGRILAMPEEEYIVEVHNAIGNVGSMWVLPQGGDK